MKKTPLYKFYTDNNKYFKEYYMRNFAPYIMSNSLKGYIASESYKKNLANKVMTDGYILLFFLINLIFFINGLNKYNTRNNDSNIYYDIYNVIPINTSTKGKGKIHVPKLSISFFGFI